MQLLVHLPDGLLRRFKRHVSVRQRSRFIQRLLEDALLPEDRDDDPLYQAALAVEEDETLAAEMAEWEAATIVDGLRNSEPLKNAQPSPANCCDRAFIYRAGSKTAHCRGDAIVRAEFRRRMRSIAGRG